MLVNVYRKSEPLSQSEELAVLCRTGIPKTDRDEKHDIKYKVLIVVIPSNLGKGLIYYFVCLFSHKRCRVLIWVMALTILRVGIPTNTGSITPLNSGAVWINTTIPIGGLKGS